MSRSYKKPYVKDGYKSKWKRYAKRNHNRKVRRKLKNSNYKIADGCAHKNGPGLNRWDICDYKFYIQKPISDIKDYGYIETYEEQLEIYNKAKRK